MGWIVKNDSVTGMIKFALEDSDGDTVSTFRINPVDVNLVSRLEEISKYFAKQAENAPEAVNVEDLVAYNDALEEKITYLIGGRSAVFDQLTAVTVMPNGNLFAVEVLEQIYDAVEPIVKDRKQKMEAAVHRHAAKYS